MNNELDELIEKIYESWVAELAKRGFHDPAILDIALGKNPEVFLKELLGKFEKDLLGTIKDMKAEEL